MQHTKEFGLKIWTELSDLIQEYGSTFRNREQAFFGFRGSRKRAFYVSEQFAFDKRWNQGTAVHRNKGLIPEWAGVMNCPCDHFLSRAAFAQDEHRV